jgi:PAS domain S-box-containing protein
VPGLATILLLANITKRSQAIAQDATLQAEYARKASRSSDEQRFQLAAIVESSGDAIIASSLDGIIRSWNKGAEHLFGYAAEEVVGRPTSLLLLPGRQGEEPALVVRLAKGEPVVPFETVRRRKDGSDLEVSVTISPIRDSRGNLVGASTAARDISDRKRAQAEVLRAREAAEAANRELEAFNYSVAHDLRAPLRAVDGFSHILLEDYGETLDAAGQEHLKRVRDAAQHMGRLIDSLLALARVTRVNLRTQQVDLSELARATTQRLKESQPERVVEVVIGDGFKEKGDATLLGAAIENLLSNAWKFTRNQPNARIEFGSVQDGEQTAYFVRDNGAGFDMAFASKLFGVFQRLHTANEFEGTGVGLATVQRIVRRHGGRVWAEGKVGEGACFHFTFGDGADP